MTKFRVYDFLVEIPQLIATNLLLTILIKLLIGI